jgi:hypothetical protein
MPQASDVVQERYIPLRLSKHKSRHPIDMQSMLIRWIPSSALHKRCRYQYPHPHDASRSDRRHVLLCQHILDAVIQLQSPEQGFEIPKRAFSHRGVDCSAVIVVQTLQFQFDVPWLAIGTMRNCSCSSLYRNHRTERVSSTIRPK